jgi:hypothetical protein
MIVNLREVIRLSPAALECACGADESWQAPREVDVNQERERRKLGRHSAVCGRFAAFAWPHARASGRAPVVHAHRADAAPHASAAGHSLR